MGLLASASMPVDCRPRGLGVGTAEVERERMGSGPDVGYPLKQVLQSEQEIVRMGRSGSGIGMGTGL
jgi:hypothetical protein